PEKYIHNLAISVFDIFSFIALYLNSNIFTPVLFSIYINSSLVIIFSLTNKFFILSFLFFLLLNFFFTLYFSVLISFNPLPFLSSLLSQALTPNATISFV